MERTKVLSSRKTEVERTHRQPMFLERNDGLYYYYNYAIKKKSIYWESSDISQSTEKIANEGSRQHILIILPELDWSNHRDFVTSYFETETPAPPEILLSDQLCWRTVLRLLRDMLGIAITPGASSLRCGDTREYV